MKTQIPLILSILMLTLNNTYGKNIQSFGEISYAKASNISGKQRMLSQRLAKVFFLRLAGASGSEVTVEYNSSLQLFERNLSILESNSKEASEKVRSSIKREQEQWTVFKNTLKNKTSKNVINIMNVSEELLKRCHSLVVAIEEEAKSTNKIENGTTKNLLQVETINIAGKQRMLSQRLCLFYTACRVYRKEKQNSKGLCSEVSNIYNEMNTTLNSLLINDLNTFTIEQKIGEILGLFEEIETHKKDFFNNKLPLSKIIVLSNKATDLYNVITGQYTLL